LLYFYMANIYVTNIFSYIYVTIICFIYLFIYLHLFYLLIYILIYLFPLLVRIIMCGITFWFFANEKYSTTDMLFGFSSLSQILVNTRIPSALGRIVERERFYSLLNHTDSLLVARQTKVMQNRWQLSVESRFQPFISNI